jgi:nicotinamidase-related amidase
LPRASKTKRIAADACCGIIVDVQEFFLAQVDQSIRCRIKANTASFARLLSYFRIPMVVTLERPLDHKGSLPAELSRHLGNRAHTFEKDFFDLTKEPPIREHLARLGRKQIIAAGCETDVCVLQSCLALIDLGYQVYLVEDLLFTSSRDAGSAIARMAAAGAVFLSYKSLYYELTAAVDGGPHAATLVGKFGPFPDDLPDSAAE